ncbi:MAG: hypothetical protein KIPDCIKN_01305 [Haliscomenobacter sp.]|jgi:hypothetical protein|nr:hypothetical protein [Haliscomenobacter sp.]
MKQLQPLLFAALAALYLWFPWSMVRYQEQILTKGAYYQFDISSERPLSGLGSNSLYIPWDNRLPRTDTFSFRQKVFVELGKTPKGKAFFKTIHKFPVNGTDYVTTKISFSPLQRKWTYFEMPAAAQTYFLDQTKIKEVSSSLQNAIHGGSLDSLEVSLQVGLRVRKGVALIDNVKLNGVPAEAFILQMERKYGKKAASPAPEKSL